MTDSLEINLKVRLKLWTSPNYAVRADLPAGSRNDGIPVAELSDEVLDEMALAWLHGLYRNAGRDGVPLGRIAARAASA